MADARKIPKPQEDIEVSRTGEELQDGLKLAAMGDKLITEAGGDGVLASIAVIKVMRYNLYHESFHTSPEIRCKVQLWHPVHLRDLCSGAAAHGGRERLDFRQNFCWVLVRPRTGS